jgi:phosphoglycerol transferase MdoB-like AlkP superfamily enzyme
LEKQQPFVLHIATGDTHPFPDYYVDPRCAKRTKGYPRILRSFDCTDQVIERFINEFQMLPLANNTEVLIYGDHLIMNGARRGIQLYEPRYIYGGMPLRPRKLITKRISIYDVAPTIMELAGVEYEPKFPFGASIFSSKVGAVPTQSHLQFIYSNFVKIMNWNPKVVCDRDFCRDRMYQSQSPPRTNRSSRWRKSGRSVRLKK